MVQESLLEDVERMEPAELKRLVEKLKIGQEAIEMESDRLRNALERKEGELRHSEERFRIISDNAFDMMVIHVDGTIIEVNEACLEISGYGRDEFVKKNFFDLYTPGSQRILKEKLRSPDTGPYEAEMVRKDGTIIAVQVRERDIIWNSRSARLALAQDIDQRKRLERRLINSEKTVKAKLDTILMPEGDIDSLELEDVVDVEALRQIWSDFSSITNMAVGILDLKGNILVSTGWQDICTKFHRMNPETAENCIRCNMDESKNVVPGTYNMYRCFNNMWDVVTPIMIGGKHRGDLYLGQFQFKDEPVDLETFRAQAVRYGFNEEEYLKALEKVPRLDRDEVERVMSFYMKLTGMISELSYGNLKLARTIAERDRLLVSLKESEKRFHSLVDNIPDPVLVIGFDARVHYANEALFKLLGIDPMKDLGSLSIFRYVRSESGTKVISDLEKIQRTGGPLKAEYDLVTSSGVERTVEGVGHKILWEGVQADLVSLRDLTDRRRTEKLLGAHLGISEHSYDHTLDELLQKTLDEAEALTGSTIGFLHFVDDDQETLTLQMWSTNTIKRMCNAEGKGQHYPISEAGVWVDCVYAKGPVIHNDLASLSHRKGSPSGHAPVIRELVVPVIKNGKVKTILGVGNKEIDYTQADVKIVSELADLVWEITERKRAEEALMSSQQMLQLVLDNVPVRVIWKDRQLNYLGCNRIAAHDAGLSDPSEIVGKNDHELAWRDSADSYQADDRQVIESGIPKINFEEMQIQSDGSKRWLQTSKVPLRDLEGGVIGVLGTYEDITERKLVEESLRQSEEKFAKAFYGNAAEMILTRLEDGRIIDVNDRWLEVTGYSREEVIGQTTNDLRIWKDPTQRADLVRDLENYGSVHYREYTFTKKNGEPIIDLLSSQIITLEGEKMILTSTLDITEKKEAEEALRRDEARNRALFDLTQMSGLTITDIVEKAMEFGIELSKSKIGYIAFLNEDESVLTMEHWSKHAMEGCGIEDKPRTYQVGSVGLWGEAVRQRKPIITNDYSSPNPLKKGYPEGHVDLKRHMNVPVFDRGRIVAVAGVGNKESDYSEQDAVELSLLMDGMWRIIRKIQAEDTLKESEERFRTLSDASFEGIIIDVAGIMIDVNEAVVEQSGYPRNELIGRSIFDFFAPDSLDDIRRLDGLPLSEAYEVHLVKRNGEIRTIRIKTRAMEYNSKPARVVTMMDVTDQVNARKRIEDLAARREEERTRLRTILDTLPVGVLIADASGAIFETNDMTREIMGEPMPLAKGLREYSIYKGWWADSGIKLGPKDWGLIKAIIKGEVSKGQVIDIERFDGKRGTILDSAAPLKDAKGEIIGGVAVIQDITAQRRLEHEAIEAKERAEMYIDLLTHDINNLNAAAKGYLQLISDGGGLDNKERKRLQKSLEMMDDVSDLIEKVKTIQKIEVPDAAHHTIDLGWVIEDVVQAYREYPGKEVTINYAPRLKCMVMASDLLEDVFSNIIDNAIKHTTGAVTINIDLVRMFKEGMEYYMVEIEDDGPGVPDDMKSEIFSRLQRGKTRASGSGLGLYLVKRLVEDFHGSVWVEDRVPKDHTKGARFVVILPVSLMLDGPLR